MKQLRTIFAAGALALVLAATAHAQAVEKKSLTLGVGGKTSLYYLPLTIAERLGYFKEQGLDVSINDFRGGAQSLQALVGGSADVVTGAYEHTNRMQAKGSGARLQVSSRSQGHEDRRFSARVLDQFLRHVSYGQSRPQARGRGLHRC